MPPPRLLGESQRAALDRVLEAWRACKAGRSKVIVLEGASGLGKTLIAHHLFSELATGQNYWPKDMTEDNGIAARRRVTHPSKVDVAAGALPDYFWWGIEARAGPVSEGANVLPEAVGQLTGHEEYLTRSVLARSPKLRLGRLFSSISRIGVAAAPLVPVVGPAAAALADAGEATRALPQNLRRALPAIAPRRHREDQVETEDHADLVATTTALLQRIAGVGVPIVALVEDAHLCDSDLGALLTNLAQSFDLPFLVLATARKTTVDWSRPWTRFIAIEEQHMERLSVQAPSAVELEEVVFKHAPRTDSDIAAALVQCAGANPYDLLQLLDLQIIRDSISGEAILLSLDQIRNRIPRTAVEDLARLQWNELPADLRPTLRCAAITASFIAAKAPALDQRGRITENLVRRSNRDCWEGTNENLNVAVELGWLRSNGESLEFLEPSRYKLAWEEGGGDAGMDRMAHRVSEVLRQTTREHFSSTHSRNTLLKATDDELYEVIAFLRSVREEWVPDEDVARLATIKMLECVQDGDRVGDALSIDLLSSCETRLLKEPFSADAAQALASLCSLHSLLRRHEDAKRCIAEALGIAEALAADVNPVVSDSEPAETPIDLLISLAVEEAMTLWSNGETNHALQRLEYWQSQIEGQIDPNSHSVLLLENTRLGLLRQKGDTSPRDLVTAYSDLIRKINKLHYPDEVFLQAAKSTAGRLHFDVAIDIADYKEAVKWIQEGLVLLASVAEAFNAEHGDTPYAWHAKSNLARYWSIATSQYGMTNENVLSLFPSSTQTHEQSPEDLIANVLAAERQGYPSAHRELIACRFTQCQIRMYLGHDVSNDLERLLEDVMRDRPDDEDLRRPIEELLVQLSAE